ncbi:MAG TPA: ATP-binding protein [Candidatus Saccharimonadales bacterium]|nr:ATP-binding protein [Candidatus Saccharimonadales bacterium]
MSDSGSRAVKLTADSARADAEQLLVQTTNATATKNSIIFNNIQLLTDNVTKYAQNVLNNPSVFPAANWRFDNHVKRMPAGYYTNGKDEPTSIYFQSYIALSPQIKRDMELLSYLNYALPQAAQNEPNAVAFYFLGTQGQTLYYPNISVGEVVPPDYNPTQDDFYTVAAPENNPEKKVRWSKIYDDPLGNGLLLTAAGPIYTANGEFKGIMGMDISLNTIAKNIEDYSPIKGSYAFLIDGSGRAIALPEKAYSDILGRDHKKGEFGVNLQNVKGGFGDVLSSMRQRQSGFKTLTVDEDKALYAAYAPIQGTDFSLGIVARQADVLKVVSVLRAQVNDSKNQVLYGQIIPFAIVLLLVVWILGFLYIRYITQPIIALTEQTRKVTQGHFKQIPINASSNEIGKLAAAFNKMTAELAKSYQALQRKVRELAATNAKDDAIFRSMGDGVVVTDNAGKVLLVNAVASKLLAIPADKAVGRQFADYELYDTEHNLIPAHNLPMHVALTSGKKVQREVLVLQQNDSKSWLAVTATPVTQAGNIIGVIQVIRDVTKEREVDRMKTEFISVASHQLRTPLSAIKWFSEMLVKKEVGELNEQQDEFARTILDSASRMNELLNALLNISRLESGRFIIKPEPTDLKGLITSAVRNLPGQTAARKQKLTVSVDPLLAKVNIDPRLVGQVYMNLLSNAIKYTPTGGKITVTVTCDQKNIISTVKDTGYGIPKQDQSKVFQKFFRASNIVSIETDGTGLGMYFVKAIVESWGGKIWFESEENKGTAFTFTLPLKGMKAKQGEVTIE